MRIRNYFNSAFFGRWLCVVFSISFLFFVNFLSFDGVAVVDGIFVYFIVIIRLPLTFVCAYSMEFRLFVHIWTVRHLGMSFDGTKKKLTQFPFVFFPFFFIMICVHIISRSNWQDFFFFCVERDNNLICCDPQTDTRSFHSSEKGFPLDGWTHSQFGRHLSNIHVRLLLTEFFWLLFMHPTAQKQKHSVSSRNWFRFEASQTNMQLFVLLLMLKPRQIE